MQVQDIMRANNASPHKLTAWARVDGVSITYPQPEQEAGAAPTGGES